MSYLGERSVKAITLFAGAAILVSVSAFGGELELPTGCRPTNGAKSTPEGYADRIVHERTGIEMVLIPAGTFMRGIEPPKRAREVTIGAAFYMGKTEVTNAQYRRFVDATGYEGKGDTDPAYDLYLRHWRGKSLMSKDDDYPVVWASWTNAKAFCEWADLALPSEAHWEYACRAGTTTYYYFGNEKEDFDKYDWVNTNSGNITHPVAEKLPNEWGLYDMLGNVGEWVEDDFILDIWDISATPTQKQIDDLARLRCDAKMTKVLKGGSWGSGTPVSRSGTRWNSAPGNASPEIGFRVMLPLEK